MTALSPDELYGVEHECQDCGEFFTGDACECGWEVYLGEDPDFDHDYHDEGPDLWM